MSAHCPPRHDRHHEARRRYEEVTEALGLDHVINLAFAGILNAVEAEVQFKRVRTATDLGVRGSAKAYSEAGHAYHRRSLGQIQAAIEAVGASRQRVRSSEDERIERVRQGYAEEFREVLRTEIVPDFRLRLIEEDDLAPAEAKLAFDTLRQPATASYDSELDRLERALGELYELRAREDRGLEIDAEVGLPRWKVVVIVIGFILVRILVAVCKWWNFIVCFIVEYIWRWVRRPLLRRVLRRCRDPRAIPNPT